MGKTFALTVNLTVNSLFLSVLIGNGMVRQEHVASWMLTIEVLGSSYVTNLKEKNGMVERSSKQELKKKIY